MAYSDKQKTEIINTICDRISKGEVLRNILNEKDMIDRNTFYKWVDADEKKIEQYARATNERADTIFDEMFTIADDQEGDIVEVDGKKVTNHHNVHRARLRIDTRKWALSKMNPTKYGEKIQQDVNIKSEQPLFSKPDKKKK